MESLKRLRNERLAHRQVRLTPTHVAGQNTSDEEVEAFYQDMAKLIRLLLGAVEHTSYNPEDTAAIYAKNAAFFWAGVLGERTEGHPSYRPPAAHSK